MNRLTFTLYDYVSVMFLDVYCYIFFPLFSLDGSIQYIDGYLQKLGSFYGYCRSFITIRAKINLCFACNIT